MDEESELVFYVNGQKIVDGCVDPETTLLQYLRYKLRLTGSKLGCGEGGCGACTVMISRFDRDNQDILHYTVNACLAPVVSIHGLAVTTVEGIGSLRTGLHPVQERLAKFHGSQCGFCTPGFVMSMYALLRNDPEPCMDNIVKSLEGNLCRCTGYRPILDGFRTFSKCCKETGRCCRDEPSAKCDTGLATKQVRLASQLQDVGSLKPYDPSQEPIFPPELQLIDYDTTNLSFIGPRVSWFRPTTLAKLLRLKRQHPSAKLVVGNTEIGIEMRIKNMLYPVLIASTHVRELNHVEHLTSGVRVGASVTLADMLVFLKTSVDKLPEFKTRTFTAIIEMLEWFAGKQIRNVACVGGNIMTASPISDLNPLFCAAGAKVTVISEERGFRELPMDAKFFTGYRKTAVMADEVLVSVLIPYTQEGEYFQGFKQAHRREDDIAIVNSGFRVRFKANTDVIDDATLSFGGMAPTTVIATMTGNIAKEKRWNERLLTTAIDSLAEELLLPPDAPGGMVDYRRSLAVSFFYKFYISIRIALDKLGVGVNGNQIAPECVSSTLAYSRPQLSSTQVFEEVGTEQDPVDPVGRPLIHQSAFKQVTGEAIYVDDMPKFEDELHVAMVVSRCAKAKILGIDTSKALALPGVVDFISAKDIPPDCNFNATTESQIFASEEVSCEGQIIGAIVADTKEHALIASRTVEVKYEEDEPIITIEEAIKANSFFDADLEFKHGDPTTAFTRCDHVIEGAMQIGGQEHFYMETHACLAVPKEDEEMEMFISTQSPFTSQKSIAGAINVPLNKVLCRVKRIGGGFGGKEVQADMFSVPTAIAAKKHYRPVRCCLDRQEDMAITGGRNPFLGKYKVGFSSDGRIQALEVVFYLNGGNTLDLSGNVIIKATEGFDNCYKFPEFRVLGRLCRTNLPSNTAFRGFGAPQIILFTENILSDVALTLGISQIQVREINMYGPNESTCINVPVSDCPFRECWDLVLHKIDIGNAREKIKEFNSHNQFRKRGIAVTPVKMSVGIAEEPFLNQGGALVQVYTDGSVLLTFGGTEMGQGLYTKMIQVASRVLQIPSARILVSESSTNTVPNTTTTAASFSTDLNGFAVKNACEKIMQRLEPVKSANPGGVWDEWVKAAYLERISLSATGFYRSDFLYFDKETGTGRILYMTCGAAYSEVEIDCLTGDHQVRKTEIVMDVGKSMNPAIDIGQIEGAFMQGYGLVALEQCKVTPRGRVLTTGPGAYKIPSVGNIPHEFNVTLLKGAPFEKAVYSSKGIGEPPIALATSVFFALKDAILSARADNGVHGVFSLSSPATPERIRMACCDHFTQIVRQKEQKETTDSPVQPFFITP